MSKQSLSDFAYLIFGQFYAHKRFKWAPALQAAGVGWDGIGWYRHCTDLLSALLVYQERINVGLSGKDTSVKYLYCFLRPGGFHNFLLGHSRGNWLRWEVGWQWTLNLMAVSISNICPRWLLQMGGTAGLFSVSNSPWFEFVQSTKELLFFPEQEHSHWKH